MSVTVSPGANAVDRVTVTVLPDNAIALTYTPPGVGKIQDASGNAAASASQAITRAAPVDTTAPTLQTIAFNPANYAQIILTYNETLASVTPAISAFGVTGKTVSAVTVSGSTVTIMLSATFAGGESATLTYTPPTVNKLQDAAGNAAIGISQNISTPAPALDADFKLGSMPAGFSTVGLASSSFVAEGLQMNAPTGGNWGTGLLIGPVWDTARPLKIYMVSSPISTNNYGGGISATPTNWLSRNGNPNSLIGIKQSFFYNATDIKQFTVAAAINTRLYYEYIKEGADIRMRQYVWDGTAYVLKAALIYHPLYRDRVFERINKYFCICQVSR